MCDVRFVKVLINIRWDTASEAAANEGVLASAFFPGEVVRDIRLFPMLEDHENALGAILHGIGHVLGFRHEHIRLAG